MEEAQRDSKNSIFPKALKVLPVITALVVGAIGAYFLIKQKPEWVGLPRSQEQAQGEIDVLVEEVGKLIALPADEAPTVATVTDVEKVKEQPFFKNAQNGDRVLIYTNARKAILYRPSERRIVEVGAVNIREQNQSGEETQAEEESPTPTPEEEDTPTPTE